MATEHTDGPAFEDLTARARIREAALRQFAWHGFRQATIRDIARAAGVSPGLVRHHFGSKEELREACDNHVLDALRRFSEQTSAGGLLGTPGFASDSRRQLQPYQRYVARALVEGSASATWLFDEIVKMMEQWLGYTDRSRTDPPRDDLRTRAALITAMALGVPVLHEHVSRAIGMDILTREGDQLTSLALLDVYSHPLISPELAASVRSDVGEPGEAPPDAPPEHAEQRLPKS